MGLEKVKDFLSDYHVIVKDDWVTQAIQVCKDYGCNSSLQQLCASVLDLFLNSDLLESYVAPMKIPAVAVKVVITKPIIFQITSAFDISRPLYEQFCELTHHKDDLSWFHGDDIENDTKENPRSLHPRKRIIKLSLFDGTNMISGLEFGSLQCVPSDVRLGAKIILTSRVVCRKGVMLLNDSNCQLLGGDIEGLNSVADPAQKYADRLGIQYSNGKRVPSLKAPDAFAPTKAKSKSSKVADTSHNSTNGNSTLSPFLVKMPRKSQPSELDSTTCSEAALVAQPLRMKEYPYTKRIPPLKSTTPFDKTTELSSCSALVSSLGSPEQSSKSSVSNTSILGTSAAEIIESCSKQKLRRSNISERINNEKEKDYMSTKEVNEPSKEVYETVVPLRPHISSNKLARGDFTTMTLPDSYASTSSVNKKAVPLNYCPPTYCNTDSSSNVSPQDSNHLYGFPSPKKVPNIETRAIKKQHSVVQPFKTQSEKSFEKVMGPSNYSRGSMHLTDNNNNIYNVNSCNNSNDDLMDSLNIVESPNISSYRLPCAKSIDISNSSTESFIPPIALEKQLRLPPLTKPNHAMHNKPATGSPRKADMISCASNSFAVPEKRVRTDILSVVPHSAVRELQTTRVFSDEEPDKSIALQDTLADPKITMVEKFKRLNIALLETSLRNKAFWMLPKVVLIQGLCHVPTDLKARNGHWVLHIHVSDESTDRLYCEVSPILLDRMLGFTVQSCQDPIVIRNKAEMQRRKVRALSVAHSLLRLDLILSVEMYPERDSVPLILDVKTISEMLNVII